MSIQVILSPRGAETRDLRFRYLLCCWLLSVSFFYPSNLYFSTILLLEMFCVMPIMRRGVGEGVYPLWTSKSSLHYPIPPIPIVPVYTLTLLPVNSQIYLFTPTILGLVAETYWERDVESPCRMYPKPCEVIYFTDCLRKVFAAHPTHARICWAERLQETLFTHIFAS